MDLPRGWRRVSLAEVSQSTLGKMLDRQKHTAGTRLPYLRNQNVRWFDVDTSDVFEMFFTQDEFERYGLVAGDVLVCEGGEPGRAAIWDGRETGMKFQKAIHRVRPTGALHPKWLVLRLWHDAQTGGLTRYLTGTTIKHFTGSALAKYELPLPPFDDQTRIVAHVDSLRAHSERAREALDAVTPLLEKVRQSILATAFRGDLTKDWRASHNDVEPSTKLLERIRAERRQKWEDIELAKMKAKRTPPKSVGWKTRYQEPEPIDATMFPKLPRGWCWAAFEELTYDSLYGPRFGANQYSEAGLPMLRTTDLDDEGNVVWKAPPKVAVSNADFVAVGLRANDLVVTRTGATIGKCALYRPADPPALPSAYLIRFGLISMAVNPEYVLQAFLSPAIQTRLRAGTTATAQPNVNARTIGRIPFPVAPIAEQGEILRRLGLFFTKFNGVRFARDASADALTDLESASLAKAFRGELVSRDGASRINAVAVLSERRGGDAIAASYHRKNHR